MDGFAPDGYIIDQNHLRDYTYRNMTSDINGCGWIAAYNLRLAAGQSVFFDDVRKEMDRMYRLPIPGPTPMRKLRRYLRRYLPFRFTAGRQQTQITAEKSRAGILRYWEGDEPHFISFVRMPDGLFRFFNVADGKEDFICPMDEFFRSRVHRGWIRTLTI